MIFVEYKCANMPNGFVWKYESDEWKRLPSEIWSNIH